tara:strand:- start:396 stop:701 length:306 start_codon:yes stop_codon:yes gene_type:complete
MNNRKQGQKTMNVLNKLSVLSVITLGILLPLPTNDIPVGKVEIVESEIEIEYIDTTVWDQWVFDTDDTTEYMTFDNETGTIAYTSVVEFNDSNAIIVAFND